MFAYRVRKSGTLYADEFKQCSLDAWLTICWAIQAQICVFFFALSQSFKSNTHSNKYRTLLGAYYAYQFNEMKLNIEGNHNRCRFSSRISKSILYVLFNKKKTNLWTITRIFIVSLVIFVLMRSFCVVRLKLQIRESIRSIPNGCGCSKGFLVVLIQPTEEAYKISLKCLNFQ